MDEELKPEEELRDSELGTLEYWQSTYKNELVNFKSHGDVGEIWFGEDIEARVVQYMEKYVDKHSRILDIGCGNGMLLMHLARNGFTHLKGVDYAEDAIKLAKHICAKYETNIDFAVADILLLPVGNYDLILDKGTYDAISLMSDSKQKREVYIHNVYNSLRDQGLLLITSCNWTKEELECHFTNKFILCSSIPTPQFVFGGKVGNVVTSVVFKKII